MILPFAVLVFANNYECYITCSLAEGGGWDGTSTRFRTVSVKHRTSDETLDSFEISLIKRNDALAI